MRFNMKSIENVNTASNIERITTMVELSRNSALDGQMTLPSSTRTSARYFDILFSTWYSGVMQARRDSNPQPSVLETDALPVELRTFGSLPRFPMGCAVVTERAEFLIFHAPSLFALVLGGGVISTLAFVAGEDNKVTGHFLS